MSIRLVRRTVLPFESYWSNGHGIMIDATQIDSLCHANGIDLSDGDELHLVKKDDAKDAEVARLREALKELDEAIDEFWMHPSAIGADVHEDIAARIVAAQQTAKALEERPTECDPSGV